MADATVLGTRGDDRRTHVERINPTPASKEDLDMNADQFAELKALLAPISEFAALQMAEFQRHIAKREAYDQDRTGKPDVAPVVTIPVGEAKEPAESVTGEAEPATDQQDA